MSAFITATREYLDTLINRRAGETKLGENVVVSDDGKWERALINTAAKFVVLGIPEDIGVRANFGMGGTHTLWQPALKALLNVQETEYLQGSDIIILGSFDLSEQMRRTDSMTPEQMRDVVNEIDDAVYPVITKIIKAGKVPIVVGGGHNNSFPLLKGASLVDDDPVNCINLDAHSDFRDMEGRHSGNGFRYAHREGYLDKYAIIGLHENYNARRIVDELKDDPDIHYSWYEDIFLRDKLSFEEAIEHAIGNTAGRPIGLELDLDCIAGVLSSAATPCGITALQARQYITMCAQIIHPVYLHLTEGAVQLRDGRTDITTAKLVTYLITDFIKAYKQKKSSFF